MTLSDLASLGSFASSFAVMISLVYLALQVRQAERNQQANIRMGRANRTVQVMLTRSDPSVARAWMKGMSGALDISEEELVQFQALCAAGLTSAEDSFYQHKEGLLNDAAFNSYVRGLKVTFSSPGMRAMWKRGGRRALGAEFVTFIDELILGIPLSRSSLYGGVADWNAAIGTELGTGEGVELSKASPAQTPALS